MNENLESNKPKKVRQAHAPTPIGTVFGFLKVLDENGPKFFCECLLDGTKKWMDKYSIKLGKTISCNCEGRRRRAKGSAVSNAAASLAATPVGSIWGRLTVIENTGHGSVVKCQCSCHEKTIVDVAVSELHNGDTRSCHCLKREHGSKIHYSSVAAKKKRNAVRIAVGTAFVNWAVVKDEGGDKILCKCPQDHEKWIYRSLVAVGKGGECGDCKDPEKAAKKAAKIARLAAPSIEYGTRFEKLCVFHHLKDFCSCKCDCGKWCVVSARDLLKNYRGSCGCAGDIVEHMASYKGEGVSGLKSLLNAYKNRGLEFTLSDGEFKSLTSLNCHYCGCEPYRLSNSGPGAYIYSGLDRVNSALGYLQANVVPSCMICNSAKSDADYADFIRWILAIGSYPTVGVALISEAELENNFGLHKIYDHYRFKAREKGRDYPISLLDFWSLSQQNCAYCKSPPCNKNYGFCYNGIDRIDPTGGYVPGNVCTACDRCNTAKRRTSKKEFTAWTERILKFQQGKIGV